MSALKMRVHSVRVVSVFIFSCCLASCLPGSGWADCRIPDIPYRISEYVSKSTKLQARRTAGRWVALDHILNKNDVRRAYGCISDAMLKSYQRTDLEIPNIYRGWLRANENIFYAPANNYGWANIFVNKKAIKYKNSKYKSKFEVGSIIIKESFVFDIEGNVSVGPFFYMEKMNTDFNKESEDWKFLEIFDDGTYAETGGVNSAKTGRCIRCHQKRRTSDFLFFIK
jgi:hypothetical protein